MRQPIVTYDINVMYGVVVTGAMGTVSRVVAGLWPVSNGFATLIDSRVCNVRPASQYT
jgi:hypothetical protein